jgi:hypothetical protein
LSSGLLVFLEVTLVLGVVLGLAFLELRSLKRADRKAEAAASAAASRHPERQEKLDPPGSEPV